MKLRHIEIVQALLQTGSLSAAARLLGISQPSATKHLQHAEGVVGYPLFKRHAGRLHPTRELLQLAPSIAAAWHSVDDVRRTALNLRSTPQAVLRVGTVPALSGQIPLAYQALLQQHPEVRCEFVTGHHHELVQWLLLHEIDVGIAFAPPGHPAMQAEELGTRRLVCAALPQLLGKYKAHRSVEAKHLATMPLIELVNTDPVGQLVATYAQRFGWRFPAALSVRTHRLALELAAQGLGVALVDDLSARAFLPALNVILVEPAAEIAVRAIFPKPGALSAAARHFIEAYRAAVTR
ncbi:MAG: LysR family transcriptional regulator [Pseudomonadota bacterium]